jgi:hypothetical protein
LASHVGSKKVTTEEELLAVLTDPVGYRLMQTLILCYSAEGKHGVARVFVDDVLSNAREMRGPRYFAFWAAVDKISEIADDKPTFKIEKGSLPGLEYQASTALFGGIGYKGDNGWFPKGQIAALANQGDMVKVTFKTVKWNQPTYSCVETRRIEKISSNGDIVYRRNCRVTGSEVKSSTEQPLEVPAVFAGGLAVGQFATFKAGASSQSGMPWLVYTDAGMKKLVSVFGVKVK